MTHRNDNHALAAAVLQTRTAMRQRDLDGPELAKRTRAYQRAANAIVEANLPLVWSFAHRFARRATQLSLDDLVQEGSLGLMRAVEDFDPNCGATLGTYAGWWIVSFMRRAVENQDRTVRVPVHLGDTKRQVNAVIGSETARLGREPTDAEVAKILKLKPAKVATLRHLDMGRLASLDMAVGDDGIAWVEITAGDVESPEEAVLRRERERQAAELLATLPSRERALMASRMNDLTLADAGRPFGISRERVRQIEARAMVTMRTAAQRRKVGTR